MSQLSNPRPLLLAAFAALIPVLLASPAAASDPGDRAEALLAAALEVDRGPGVQAAIVRDGELVWTRALGFADLESSRPMETTTRLRIGSVSKILTAALAATLADEGLLDLDGPVGQHLPELPATYAALTPRQLAGHVAGVRHYDFGNFEEANNQKRWDDLVAALDLFLGDPLVSAPGEEFHYSSFGFNLLGAAAARAAGADYLEALASRVTGPLGLGDTVGDRPWALVPRRGRFYTVPRNGPVINTPWRDSSDYYPSGGLLSTAQDLARAAWEIFRGDLLSEEAVRLLSIPTRLGDGSEGPYAFGWQVLRGADGRPEALTHGGLTNGATAEVRFLPDAELALAVVANYNFWFEDTPEVLRVTVEEIPDLFRDRSSVGAGDGAAAASP